MTIKLPLLPPIRRGGFYKFMLKLMEINQVADRIWSELHISIINQHGVNDKEIFSDYLKAVFNEQEFYIHDLTSLLWVRSDIVGYYSEAIKVLDIWNKYQSEFYPWELAKYLSLERITSLYNCISQIEVGIVKPKKLTPKERARVNANKFNQKAIFKIIERDGYVCKICGATKNLTVDHIIPIARGGKNTLKNCQLLCKSCNSRKGARC